MTDVMNGDTPKLTLSQRLHEVTMASLGRRTAEPESSVTITRNAKGVYQFEVTVRGSDAVACADLAESLVTELVAAHPYPVETPFGEARPE